MPKSPQKRREEIIDHLVGNCDCGKEAQFSEADIEVLNKFSVDQLEALMGDEEKEQPVAPAVNEKKEEKQEEVKEPVKNSKEVQEFDENKLPESVREELQFARNMMQEKKEELVTKITANKSCLFTKEDLLTKSIDDLTKIASLVDNSLALEEEEEEAAARFTPRLGGHRAPTGNKKEKVEYEILDLPVMNFGN